jgi:hypothetical protein
MSPSPTVCFHGWHVWVIVIGAGRGFLRKSNFNYMAKTNKNSRRQQLINLEIDESLSFPPSTRSAVKSQLSELKFSTGQRYSVTSSQEKIIVTRIS